ALARRGEHASAVALARAAVDIAAATDGLLHHAEARLALAAALRAAGRSDEAAAEQARAIELWEAKGATLPAERARRGATADPAAAPAGPPPPPAARLAPAAALRAAGGSAEAAAEQARAIELGEAKGATLPAERARRGATAGARAASAPLEAVHSRRAARRSVQANHATLHLARIDEAVAARDLQAVRGPLGATQPPGPPSGRPDGTHSR